MGIENESDDAVAENGGSGDDLYVPVEPAQILDDGLMIADDLVYNESVAPMLGFGDHDLLAFGPFTLYFELFAEADIGDNLATNIRKMFAICLLYVLSRQFDTFKRIGKWQYEIGFPDTNEQSVDDGHRERKP